jgi:hypothetical protein
MMIYLVKGSTFEVNRAPLSEHFVEGTRIDYDPHIDYAWADRTCGVYTLSHGDILGEDWMTV